MAMTKDSTSCDSCGHDALGYTLGDLKPSGWRAMPYGPKPQKQFILCDICVTRYQPAWDALKAEPAPVS